MKSIILAVLILCGSASAITLAEPFQVTGCTYIGQVRAGDGFNTMDKQTAVQSILTDAAQMSGDAAVVSVTSSTHPKLGKRYWASATIWKCGK